MDKELLEKELYPFLNLTTKEELKTIALENVVGLTGSEEGLSYIRDSDLLLTAIVTLTEDKRSDIQEQSFTALINLTTNEATCQRILQLKNCENKVSDWLALVIDANYKFADLVCKLLSNLTRSEQCAKLASNVVLQNEKVNIEKIVLVLCNVAYNKNANLHYLAAILSNLSQVREIRTRIMDKEQCTIQRLLPFTEFKQSSVRRAGVIGTLKNCCFDTEYHDWLLSDDVELLPRLLLPLAGPEEFDDDDMEKLPDMLQYLPEDKQRETEPHIRKMITEAILQLCATKKGRHYVKEKNTYVIMREYYAWERKQDLFNEISAMNLIDVLISDEPGEDFGENLKEVEIPEDLTEKFINDDSKELKLAETEMAELSKETSK